MAYGTIQAYRTPGGQVHLGASAAPVFGHVTYIAIAALVRNLAVSAVLTVLFRKIGLQDGYDETWPADYFADPVTVPPVTAETRIPRYSVIRLHTLWVPSAPGGGVWADFSLPWSRSRGRIVASRGRAADCQGGSGREPGGGHTRSHEQPLTGVRTRA